MNNNKCVIFIIERNILAQLDFEHSPQDFIVLIPANMIQPLKQSSGVGVDDKHRARKGIQQHVVCGFGADTVYRQQGLAQFIGRHLHQGLLATLLQQPATKGTQALGLDIEITRGLEPACQALGMGLDYGSRTERLGLFEIIDSALNIDPGGILRQYRPDHNLEAAITRPPVLPAIGPEQLLIHPL